jgi:ribosomal protein S18 acetylase RimI-like enzyme
MLELGEEDEKVTLGRATMESTASEAWLTTCCQMNQINDRNKGILQRMLGNIIPAKCFASIYHDETVVACGMGVRQGEYVGLFDLVVHPNYRGRGYGTQLVLNLLAWGKKGNARRAYLQVMLNNHPALYLYQKVGFREHYQYWYRIKS